MALVEERWNIGRLTNDDVDPFNICMGDADDLGLVPVLQRNEPNKSELT